MSASASHRTWSNVVALSGGVGGARLLHGLERALPPGALTAVVNTGDDFEHWGLAISPDLDTVMYTLADLAPEERGWGLAEESFAALEVVKRYGGDTWFALGDRDLGTHLMRSQALSKGETLTSVTARLCKALGVRSQVLPMADGPCRTHLVTPEGESIPFQEWFVRRRTGPVVREVRFEGSPPPAPGLIATIEAAELVVIGPSNPYVSVDPILHLPGVRNAIARRPVVAMSPIVNGEAVKGPLASMITSMTGQAPTALAVARHYAGLLSGFVVERGDEGESFDVPTLAADTIMRTRADSLRLAREVLAFAESLAPH